MNDSFFDILPDGGKEVKQSVAEVGQYIATPTVAGAVAGSFIPGVGTAIGAGVGALAGSSVYLAGKIKERIQG